jgi:hypothetical protein
MTETMQGDVVPVIREACTCELEQGDRPARLRWVDTIRTSAGPRQATLVSESGLYSLILRSRKPEAGVGLRHARRIRTTWGVRGTRGRAITRPPRGGNP